MKWHFKLLGKKAFNSDFHTQGGKAFFKKTNETYFIKERQRTHYQVTFTLRNIKIFKRGEDLIPDPLCRN